MPLNDQLVKLINDQLSPLFPGARIEGIAETILRNENGKAEMFPAIIDNKGNVSQMVVDDTDYLAIYHKLNGNTYTNSTRQYGKEEAERPGAGWLYDSFCRQDRVDKTPQQMEGILVKNFPDLLETSIDGVYRAEVKLKSTNLDTNKVFSGSHQGFNPFISSDHYLIRVNYTIEITFDKNCIDICC